MMVGKAAAASFRPDFTFTLCAVSSRIYDVCASLLAAFAVSVFCSNTYASNNMIE